MCKILPQQQISLHISLKIKLFLYNYCRPYEHLFYRIAKTYFLFLFHSNLLWILSKQIINKMQKQSKQSTKTVAIFTLNGINSLLGWNAVLAALDYFAYKFEGYNIYSFLPIPLFVGYIIIGLTFHQLSSKFKYVSLIIFGNMLVNLALGGMLIISIALDQTQLGFILLLACSFIIGIGGNINEVVMYAMINYLSADVVSKYTVGTAVSGLFITAIRAIVLAVAGDDRSAIMPTIIYFCIAIGVNMCVIVMNIFFCRSEVYRDKIDAFLLNHDESFYQPNKTIDPNGILSEASSRNKSVTPQYVKEEERIESQSYLKTMKETFKDIFPFPLILILNYIITFTLFPGPTLSKTFPSMSNSWSNIAFLLAYNIGDTVGKYSGGIDGIFNKHSLIYSFFGRLVFYLPIIVMANGTDLNDELLNNLIFPFVNQFLFGVTNGFVTNCCFIISFKVSSLTYKKYAGVLCGLSIELGIILGTILEVPLAYAIGIA